MGIDKGETTMTRSEFLDCLKSLKMTQVAFSRHYVCGLSTVRHWGLPGYAPVPRWVQVTLRKEVGPLEKDSD